jgi:hypothetical protein
MFEPLADKWMNPITCGVPKGATLTPKKVTKNISPTLSFPTVFIGNPSWNF